MNDDRKGGGITMKRIGTMMAVALVLLPWAAHARGTAAGTTISNTVTVNYSVNGTGQTPVSPAAPATFVVDHAVDAAVTTLDAAPVTVTPGGAGYVLTFKVTNLSNAAQDFALSAVAVATGGAAKFGGADTADMKAPVSVFVDKNGNGAYDPGTDTATFIDELAADAYATVFIVADAPNTLVNGDIASYHLVATAHKAGTANTLGAVETQTPAASQTLGAVDTLFVDAAGTNDAARDGKHSDQDDYKVASAVISVSKSAAVADPYGSNAAVPGATVTYTITVSNAATASASAILGTISDTLDANLSAVTTAGAATWQVTNSTRATPTGTLTLDAGDANGDGLGITGSTVSWTLTTILAADAANGYAAGELKPGETLTLTFQATIK